MNNIYDNNNVFNKLPKSYHKSSRTIIAVVLYDYTLENPTKACILEMTTKCKFKQPQFFSHTKHSLIHI